MATFLDLGILSAVQVVFPFLLILVFCWATLMRVPVFKEKPAWAITVAVVLAFMGVLSPITVKTISLMSPWFVLVMVFGVLAILAYQSMGIKDETILKVLTGENFGGDYALWMLGVILVIGLGSLLTVIGEQRGGVPGPGAQGNTTGAKVVYAESQSPSGQSGAFFNTIFHPKVLGMAAMLIIAAIAIGQLSSQK